MGPKRTVVIISADFRHITNFGACKTSDFNHSKETIAGKVIDQRADVGLLSRNVRFYGEMSSETCQYARTREQETLKGVSLFLVDEYT